MLGAVAVGHMPQPLSTGLANLFDIRGPQDHVLNALIKSGLFAIRTQQHLRHFPMRSQWDCYLGMIRGHIIF